MMMRSTILLSLSLSLFSMSAAVAGALDDHEYVRPDGEDAYGESYRTEEIPSEMWEILDENGEYEVPSFLDRTVRRGEQECWVFAHTPAAGVKRTCEQTFEVQLRYTCDGEDEYLARLPVTLVDVHPPVLSVQISANQEVQYSHCGLPYYIAPVTVSAVVDASDPCDPEPTYEELFLNGESYVSGDPISDIGLHTLMIVVRDASGNRSVQSKIFEIRDRPIYAAAAVVEATACAVTGNGDVESFSASVLLSTELFEPAEMSSIRMILFADDGRWLHNELIRPVEAESSDCYLRLKFSLNVPEQPLAECPAILDLIGVGVVDGGVEYSWGARTLNEVPTSPTGVLLTMVGREMPCGELVDIPVPEPPGCNFEQRWNLNPDRVCVDEMSPVVTDTCRADGESTVTAMSTTVFGNGDANALHAAPPGSCSADADCGSWNQGAYIARFVGCCENCSISIGSHANVRVLAFAGGTNSFTVDAKATGKIDLLGSCGDQDIIWAEVRRQVPLHTPGQGNDSQSGGTSCSEDACEAWLKIETSGHIRTNCTATATANIFGHPQRSDCRARGRVMCDGVRTQLNASANPCDGGDPLIITSGE